MFDALCNDGGLPGLLKEAYEEGKCGVKNCKGFYDYSDGKDQTALAGGTRRLSRCATPCTENQNPEAPEGAGVSPASSFFCRNRPDGGYIDWRGRLSAEHFGRGIPAGKEGEHARVDQR